MSICTDITCALHCPHFKSDCCLYNDPTTCPTAIIIERERREKDRTVIVDKGKKGALQPKKSEKVEKTGG